MPGKWEWIEESLNQLSLNPLARKARRIKEAIQEIYGFEIRSTFFKVDRCDEANSLRRILDITEASHYCTPCQLSRTCLSCIFGEQFGRCSDPASMFGKFRQELKELVLLHNPYLKKVRPWKSKWEQK